MFQYATMLYHKILTLGSCVAATLTEQLETLDEAFNISAGQLGAHAQATSASIPLSITGMLKMISI